MDNWALLCDGGRYEDGVNTSISAGKLLGYVGAANVKGSWVELVASTAFDCSAIVVTINPTGGSKLIDIGLGASTVIPIVENLFMGTLEYGTVARQFLIPISIPKGTRLWARHQGSGGFSYSYVAIQLIAGGFNAPAGFNRCTTYGAISSGASRGTMINPGGSANNKGAWTEIISATTNPIEAVLIGLGQGAAGQFLAMHGLLDIGIGPATEVVAIPNLYIWGDNNARDVTPNYGWLPLQIPRGTRLSARLACSGAANNNLYIVIYGVD